MKEHTWICCVVNIGTASHVMKLAKELGVQGGTIFLGHGTVYSSLPKFFGLNEERKEIVNMITEKSAAGGVVKSICDDMKFHMPHHGIAFTLDVSGFTGHKNSNIINNDTDESEERDSMYQIIYTIVDRGMAEDVIEAANEAGAQGGTIINARGSGIHEAQKLFSIEIEPEKEIVFTLVKSELKDAIVDSIKERLKLDEPGNGVMFIMDVNEVYGLHDS